MKHANTLVCEVIHCPGCGADIFCDVVSDRALSFYLSEKGDQPIEMCPQCRLDLGQVSREDLNSTSRGTRRSPAKRAAGKKEMVAAMLAGDIAQFPSKAAAERAFDAAAGAVLELAKTGRDVRWPGVGSFKIKEQKARRVRNPQTGTMMEVPAKKAVKFTPAKRLKEAVEDL